MERVFFSSFFFLQNVSICIKSTLAVRRNVFNEKGKNQEVKTSLPGKRNIKAVLGLPLVLYLTFLMILLPTDSIWLKLNSITATKKGLILILLLVIILSHHRPTVLFDNYFIHASFFYVSLFPKLYPRFDRLLSITVQFCRGAECS